MADADTKENTSQNSNGANQGSQGDNGALNAQLTQVQEELRKMNERMEATQNAIAESNRVKVTKEDDDENIYDPKVLSRKMEAAFDTKLRAERQKDLTIYNLAQEYPEIQTDSKIRAAVLEAQNQIPASLRDTADGYEMAVLKAVSKAGLMPKSKRQVIDDDVSISPRSSGTRPTAKRTKVSDRTLQVAEMLGRDISDPKVLAGLEEAANRDTYNKYR